MYFAPLASWRCQAQTVRYNATSSKINYVFRGSIVTEFVELGGFGLGVELHQQGFAPTSPRPQPVTETLG